MGFINFQITTITWIGIAKVTNVNELVRCQATSLSLSGSTQSICFSVTFRPLCRTPIAVVQAIDLAERWHVGTCRSAGICHVILSSSAIAHGLFQLLCDLSRLRPMPTKLVNSAGTAAALPTARAPWIGAGRHAPGVHPGPYRDVLLLEFLDVAWCTSDSALATQPSTAAAGERPCPPPRTPARSGGWRRLLSSLGQKPAVQRDHRGPLAEER